MNVNELKGVWAEGGGEGLLRKVEGGLRVSKEGGKCLTLEIGDSARLCFF